MPLNAANNQSAEIAWTRDLSLQEFHLRSCNSLSSSSGSLQITYLENLSKWRELDMSAHILYVYSFVSKSCARPDVNI